MQATDDKLIELLRLTRTVGDDGIIRWFNIDGQLHRTDGPTIEYPSGTKKWWHNGELHRTDGPAVEYPNGHEIWYENGMFIR
jgi:hypothetical protein